MTTTPRHSCGDLDQSTTSSFKVDVVLMMLRQAGPRLYYGRESESCFRWRGRREDEHRTTNNPRNFTISTPAHLVCLAQDPSGLLRHPSCVSRAFTTPLYAIMAHQASVEYRGGINDQAQGHSRSSYHGKQALMLLRHLNSTTW